MAGLLRPPSTVFSAPRCSPPPLQWSPRQPTAARHRATRIRSSASSSTSESSPSTTTAPIQSTTATVKLTYLEFNGWVWELDGGFRILVDPILDGNLDFGIPWLFDAAKKTLKADDGGLVDLAGIDLLLITQSLDDHCHLRTLTRISAAAPDLPVVTTPNAQPIISALPFTDVKYLEPGQSTAVDGGNLEVLATAGPVLGPPWQRPENGYILTTTTAGQHKHSLYYEPHCVYDAAFLRDRGLRADVLITPVVRQLLPANFTLVSGQEDAVDLAKQLRPSHVVPMSNGDFDAKGLLTAVLTTQGTIEAFKALLREALPQVQVVEPTAGVPLQIDLQLNHNTSSSSP
ncbi:unnamed protein product [Alopecurus aequalis]